jgi:GC-rich sequence DNA-binding factor
MSSDSPVIFKRSKAKSAARARPVSPEKDAETSTSQTVEDSPITLATKLKNKIKKTKTKSRLSFGGDEEVSFIFLIKFSMPSSPKRTTGRRW